MSSEGSRYGLLVIAAIGYTAFVIYGSLVPLNFRPIPLSAAFAEFDALRLEIGAGSRIDWATNVVLTIPLAFLWAGVLWPARSAAWRLPAMAAVFICCFAVSIAVEFAQLFFPSRTPSLIDIAAQALGELIGITLWWFFGMGLMRWVASLPLARGRVEISARLLAIYLFVLLGYNVLPLDLSVNPVELYRKWREGGVVILPFGWRYTDRAQQLYEYVSDIVIWMPVAFLWRLSNKEPNVAVWVKVVAAAALIEFLQLFIMSRISDSTDIVLAAVGATIGIGAAQRVKRENRAPSLDHGAHRDREPSRLALWIVAALVWLVVLTIVFWYPFNFDFDPSFLRRRILALKQVPLEAYWKGSPFRAVTEVLHKTGFLFPLGIILGGIASSFPRRPPRGLVHAGVVLFVVSTASAIECVQLALPRKNVDLTDWFLEASGGIAGYLVFVAVHSRLRRPRSASGAS